MGSRDVRVAAVGAVPANDEVLAAAIETFVVPAADARRHLVGAGDGGVFATRRSGAEGRRPVSRGGVGPEGLVEHRSQDGNVDGDDADNGSNSG